MPKQYKWWCSWWQTKEMNGFAAEYPWWVTGALCSIESKETICAAIKAPTLEKVIQSVLEGYSFNCDDNFDWRFIIKKQDDWDPFCDRFEKDSGVVW